MRKALGLLIVSLIYTASAGADWCRHSKDLAAEMSLDGVTTIEIVAVSGDLEVTGGSDVRRVSATGTACVRPEDRKRIDEIKIVEEHFGSTLRITAEVPFIEGDDWRIGGLDLELQIPDHLPVFVTDTSGDVEIENVFSLDITDSSGDVTIRRVTGNVHVDRDSSGDLDIRDVGDVVIDVDSSGDIELNRTGSVSIGKDSSGGIYANDINGNLLIGTDSSGSIEVANVSGDFKVERDTSGGISYRDVAGLVSIPDDD